MSETGVDAMGGKKRGWFGRLRKVKATLKAKMEWLHGHHMQVPPLLPS